MAPWNSPYDSVQALAGSLCCVAESQEIRRQRIPHNICDVRNCKLSYVVVIVSMMYVSKNCGKEWKENRGPLTP